MRNYIVYGLFLHMIAVVPNTSSVYASDYMVELFEEHYKEKMIPGTGDMKVNHTWQVKTIYGNKVLILLGNDYNLRKWVRRDAKRHKLWVAKVPDVGDDRFKYNMSVYMDLQQVQPVYHKKWNCDDCRSGAPPIKPPPPPPIDD